MRTTTFTMLGLAALLFASCSSDESYTPDTDATRAIAPVAYIQDTVTGSRAVGSVDGDMNFSASIFRVDQSETTEAYPADYAGVVALPAAIADGAVTITPEQLYQFNDLNTKLIAVHPSTTEGAAWNAAAGTVTYAIDGTTDIMTTGFGEGNRLSETQPTLTFNHLLSRVAFKVYADDATSIGLWKSLKSIRLNDQPTTCVVTLPVPTANTLPTAAYSGAGALYATALNGSAADVLDITATDKADAQLFGYTLLSPDSDVLDLTLTTGAGETLSISIDIDFSAGTTYVVYLRLSKFEVFFEGSSIVKEWVNSEDELEEIL